ncbi:MAG: hypothetical protein ACRC1Z_26480, partial [Waterburya sp.]
DCSCCQKKLHKEKYQLVIKNMELITELAQDLGIGEIDVVDKGVKLMGAYRKIKRENCQLIIENPLTNTRQELIVIPDLTINN